MQKFRTYQLALTLHRACSGLRVAGELRDQLHRASLSVVLNLAEGSGKLSVADRRRFFSMAFGSLREVQACLEIVDNNDLVQLASATAGHLYKLVKNPGYLIKP